MKTRTLLAILAILVLLPAATAMVEKGANEQKPQGEERKELSNTQIASCLVKITCDPAVLPLNLGTIRRLLYSSGIRGKAAREILEIPLLSNKSIDMVAVIIDPLSDDPASDAPKVGGRRKEVQFDEEEEYMREMKVLGRKKQATPMRGGPTYAAEQTLFFRLEVSLSKEVKPAAEEFMKALIENLRKTLDAAFDDYRKRFKQQLEFAKNDVRHAEVDLMGLQEKLREILGSHNLDRQAILDDISRSRKQYRATKMELETNAAFMEATSKRIAETEKKMMNKLANDPVLAELQKIIKIHEERLKKLMRKGTPEELSQARENLARARIELAERREQVSQSADAELIASLRNQISELLIQEAQGVKRMPHLRGQLDDARGLLERADEYERLGLRLKIAKRTFEDALLLQSRMKRKTPLIGPSVLVLGAD